MDQKRESLLNDHDADDDDAAAWRDGTDATPSTANCRQTAKPMRNATRMTNSAARSDRSQRPIASTENAADDDLDDFG